MRNEWLRCPRCKNKNMKPELINTESNGSDNLWWVCENFMECNFPLDMPPHVYHVTQTAYQKRQKCVPLPNINRLPEKYHYLYPMTFISSRPVSRCSSVISNGPYSRNETTSDVATSEKSSEQNRLKAESLHSAIVKNSTNTPSTSAQTFDAADQENDNIDEEIEAASKKRTMCRTVVRRRYCDSTRSWATLIEKVAADPKAADAIINMEESELFLRMKEFFDAQYFQRNPMAYKRSGPRLEIANIKQKSSNSYSRVTYRIEDLENCLKAITHDEWKNARKRIPQMSRDDQVAIRTATSEELLKSVGIDLRAIRKAVEDKVGKAMRGFSKESLAKRRKIDEERQIIKKKKEESLKNTIHLSVSAKILDKKLKRDEESRSLATTPALSTFGDIPVCDETAQQLPVQFHVGREEDQLDQEPQWGFDFDGLYESIHTRNNQPPVDPSDPLGEILLDLDEPGADQNDNSYHDLIPHEHSGDEGDDNENEEDDFTGFNGLESSNFVNDNFGF